MSMYPQDELVTSSGACAAAGGWFTWHGKLIYRSMSTANNNKVGGGFLFRYIGYGARKGHQCRRLLRCCPRCVSGWMPFFCSSFGNFLLSKRIRDYVYSVSD